MSGATATLAAGDRLPGLRLPRAGAGGDAPLRGPHRDAVVVVALHDPSCQPCRAYLQRLDTARSRFRLWDGTVIALTDDPAGGRLQAELGDGVVVLVDEERAVLERLAAGTGPTVVVADRYGQVFHLHRAGEEHAITEPRELEEWLRYLATQCPE